MTTKRSPRAKPPIAKKRQTSVSGARDGARHIDGIPIPSLSEQQRIVALLEASFERLDAIAAAVTELARHLHGPEFGVVTADAAKRALLSKAFDGVTQSDPDEGHATKAAPNGTGKTPKKGHASTPRRAAR